VTVGTPAGTSQISGPEYALYLTPFGNKLLFQGEDNKGGGGLWVTDGTVAGTYEVGGANDAGVTGARSQGSYPGAHSVMVMQAHKIGS
jgi:ELWxxDGT repeat protein